MQYPFTEGVTEVTKAQFKKQPSAVTAEAANRPTIKRGCPCSQVTKNRDTDIKVHPKRACFPVSQYLASPFPSEKKSDRNRTMHCQQSCLICLIIKRVKGPRQLLLCL